MRVQHSVDPKEDSVEVTIWEVLWALTRRWYVVVAAFAAGLAAFALVSHSEGVYWSRSEVTFFAPASATYPNPLKIRSSDLIITAGIVAKLVNGNATWVKMSDPLASIAGEGVYNGWSVRLPDYGGQWSTVYSRQVLEVQVTGPTAEVVEQRRAELLQQIDAELAGLQKDVVESDRITTAVVPADAPVYYVHGSKMRALAMSGVLIASAAVGAVVALEHRARRRGRIPAGSARVQRGKPPQHVGSSRDPHLNVARSRQRS